MSSTKMKTRMMFVALLMVCSTTLATNVNANPPTEASEFYYGVEYDWSSIDSDLDNFTGLDLPEILAEVMGAADDAGFELIIGQINTGSSNVYVHYTEDITPKTIQDYNGQDVQVWSRTTDVTLRHGGLIDGILMTEWSETKPTFGSQETKIDIDASTSIQNMLNVDMVFTEYLNNDYDLVGADMEFSMETQTSTGLSLDALFKGGGESLPIDFDFGMSYGYSITDSTSEWRLEQPDSVYKDMSESGQFHWSCPDCGTLIGDYDGSVDYSVELTGIPTEEFGLDQGEFDIEVSDEITKLNQDYDGDMVAEFEFDTGDELTVDLGDGDGLTTTVQTCETCPPGNPIMFIMMGNVIAGASAAFAEEIAEEFSEDLTENLAGIFGLSEGESDGELYEPDYFYCDNGEAINPWYVNDGYEHCSDGSDEDDLYINDFYGYSTSSDTFQVSLNGGISSSVMYDLTNSAVKTDFNCRDGSNTIPWYGLNDGYYDCTDGSDEFDESNPTTFSCDNGDMISFELVSDGVFDCMAGDDEGYDNLYVLTKAFYDTEGNVLASYSTYICDDYTFCSNPTYINDDYPVDHGFSYGQHNICAQLSISNAGDTGWPGIESDQYCSPFSVGPSFEHAELSQTEDGNLGWSIYVFDGDNAGDSYVEIDIRDPNDQTVYSQTVPHSNDYSISANGEFSPQEYGNYCLHATIHNSDDNTAFAHYISCWEHEESNDPSEKITTIVEAIIDSNLGEVMEAFGENLNTRMETIEPLEEFPYTDGMWAPMWSNQHAAIVGVGVYVMDDNGAYTMAGPETSGYSSSNLPAVMSIRYLTGADANTAAADMEGANQLSDIVDVNQHDLSQITQDLEDAGIDTSGLDLATPNANDGGSEQESEAEEKSDSDGLLPFVSPLAVLGVIALAGIAFGNRKNE